METTMHSYFSIPPRNFSSGSSRLSGSGSDCVASVDESDVRQFLTPRIVGSADLVGAGLCYRHDWGYLSGGCHLFLEWGAVTPRSRVFVSIAEGSSDGPDAGKFMGGAKFRLVNVAPTKGGVGVRVDVDGSIPIRLFTDYLVINA